jgi:hypothetical protein
MNVRISMYAGAVVALAILAGCGEPPKPVVTPNPPPIATPPKDATPPAMTPDKTQSPTNPQTPPKADAGGGDKPPVVDPKAAAAAGTKPVNVSGHSFALPGQWKVIPPSNAMRKFQAIVTKAAGDGEDGDFSVSIAGGGVDGNISRWAGQFGGADSLKEKREIKTAGGASATIAELQGPYAAMTMQGQQPPKEGYAQLGAIIVTPEGDYFLKLVGPKKTIEENKAAFEAMVGSFK